MADYWNITAVETLDDTNYLWREKIEEILRVKKLWKKVIEVKPPAKPQEDEENYDTKYKAWNEWDDDNYAARTIILNTMTKAQLLSQERCADKLWYLIKNNMAAEIEQLRARSLSELSNLRMKKEAIVDTYINRAKDLKNQCVQLDKPIEEYELRIYVLKGLKSEFDQNVRVLECQRDVTINDIRYTLKQEELRKEKRREDKTVKANENVREVREISKSEIYSYNCGKKSHVADECYSRKKCFNCQGV